jgi:hypothetical protein
MRRDFIFISVFFVALCILAVNLSARVLHVFPDGSGDYPNIQLAIDDAVDGDTVMLADGIFSGRANFDLRYNGKEITVCSQSGNAEACVIDVQGRDDGISQRGFIFDHNENWESELRDLSIIHGSADALCPDCEGGAIEINNAEPTIINVICRDNFAASGGGISCNHGTAYIYNCQLLNNTSFEGGGFYCLDSSQADMVQCLVSGNSAAIDGGGITMSSNCTAHIFNCTISNNSSNVGGGATVLGSDPVIINSIISFNSGAASFYADSGAHLTISYTDIFGNSGGDWIDSITGPFGVNGNINQDPMFADTANGDFHLTQNSPCIDAGDPFWIRDPDSTIADMGAFYYNQASIVNDGTPLSKNFSLSQNYPNPFNASTTIEYSLPSASNVNIDIYDILGRIITTLLNGQQQAGRHQIIWNAAGLSSGIYLCRMQAAGDVVYKKMILLK